MSKVDFHLHSSASDGLFTPRQVMEISALAGLRAAGLTDHDTICGLSEAKEAAVDLGVELVPGVEISIYENNREIHLLGYYPRKINELRSALDDIRGKRFRRMALMVENLNKIGLKVKPEEVLEEAGDAAPGRLHLARLMLKKKYVHTINEAFKIYLNRGKPAFVSRESKSAPEILDLLQQVGAISVYAHPGHEGKEVIDNLVASGLQGIEVFHPDHSRSQVNYYKEYADAKNLLITGGSDFHGKNFNKPGYQKQYAISYEYLEAMKELAGR